MSLSTSVKMALAIFAVVVLYFGVRTLLAGGSKDEEASGIEPSLFAVVAQKVPPKEWRDTIVIRGQTEAERNVIVRAETPGTIAETPARQGAFVEKGAVLCRQKIDARRASVTEAKASLAKARLDYEAAKKLTDEGFRSETSLAGLKAAYDLSRANLEQATVNLNKTNIVAPFDGIFENRLAEVGDFLSAGDPCGVVVQRSPFLIVGSVPERDVAKIAIGDEGLAKIATGEELTGNVKYIARSADPATRTFRVELEVPNLEGKLRDGVTAEFSVFAKNQNAHLIPRSSLTLNDKGFVGVRTVNKENTVVFNRVNLIGESLDGVWVTGIDGDQNVITRGQDYVSEGQAVEVHFLEEEERK